MYTTNGNKFIMKFIHSLNRKLINSLSKCQKSNINKNHHNSSRSSSRSLSRPHVIWQVRLIAKMLKGKLPGFDFCSCFVVIEIGATRILIVFYKAVFLVLVSTFI